MELKRIQLNNQDVAAIGIYCVPLQNLERLVVYEIGVWRECWQCGCQR